MPTIAGQPSYPGQNAEVGTSHVSDKRPPSEIDDDADLLARLKQWHRESFDGISDWREEATEDFRFRAGDQWDQETIDAMIEEGRQPIVFNRIGAVIDAVNGLQINNVEEAIFKPRGPDDAKISTVATEIVDSLREECDAQDEETSAFEDCIVCGLGVLETRIDEDGDLKPIVERLSPLEVGWDTAARKRNFIDRRFDWVAREVGIHEARAMYPEFEDEDLDAVWASDTSVQKSNNSPEYKFGHTADNKPKDLVTIVDFQWWERRPTMRVTDPATGIDIEITPEQAETLVTRAEQLAAITGEAPTIQMQRVNKKVWFHAIVGSKVLYKGELPVQDGQGGRKFLTGKLNKANNMPYGLVRNAKDPQRAFNKHITQQIHLINTTAKSGVMHEEDAIPDPVEFEERMSQAGARLEVANGALTSGAVQIINPPTISQALVTMAEISSGEINQATGVNLETLGLLDRDQAGVETHQRKQSTVTNLAWAFDALRIARKDCSRSMILYAIEYTPSDVLVELLPEPMTPFVVQMQQMGWSPKNVVIDEAPSSPNAKERAWAFLQNFISLMAAQGMKPQTWVALMRLAPIPSSVVDELEKTMLAPPSEQEQAQQAESQARLARMQDAEASKDEADAIYKRARAAAEAKEANLAITQAVGDTLGRMSTTRI